MLYTQSENGNRFSSRVDLLESAFYVEVYKNESGRWVYEINSDCDTCLKTNNNGWEAGDETKEKCFESVKEAFLNEIQLFAKDIFGLGSRVVILG